MHPSAKFVLIILSYQCFLLTMCNSQIGKPKKPKSDYSGENDCSLSWDTGSDAPVIDHENFDFNPGLLQRTGRVIIKTNSDFKLSCINGNFVTPETLKAAKEVTVKCKEGNTLEYQNQPYKYEQFKCSYEPLNWPKSLPMEERLKILRKRSAARYFSKLLSKFKFYHDLLMPTSRSVFIFLKTFKIPFEPHVVSVRQEKHLTPEFASINPFQKLPVMNVSDKGLILIEGMTIMRYLSNTHEIPDRMYPVDPLRQARVDEFIEWHHSNMKQPFYEYFHIKVLEPLKNDKLADTVKLEPFEKKVNETLDLLENVWLKEKPFLGGKHITIADLVGACEVEQTKMGGFYPFENRPQLSNWIDLVKKEFAPHYEDAHSIVQHINRVFNRFHFSGSAWLDIDI